MFSKLSNKEQHIINKIINNGKYKEVDEKFFEKIYDVINCSKYHEYTRYKYVNFNHNTFDEKLKNRDITILMEHNENVSGLMLRTFINPTVIFGSLHYVIFKHPRTDTWFSIENMSLSNECHTCDGTTDSIIIISEEHSLARLIRLHFTDVDRQIIFNDKNYLCSHIYHKIKKIDD